jgi:hypothetical protein
LRVTRNNRLKISLDFLPGSVISAIQMRTAMEDGVLVPWKKNRPEDTKTAWSLLHADRGGLYLDSKPWRVFTCD